MYSSLAIIGMQSNSFLTIISTLGFKCMHNNVVHIIRRSSQGIAYLVTSLLVCRHPADCFLCIHHVGVCHERGSCISRFHRHHHKTVIISLVNVPCTHSSEHVPLHHPPLPHHAHSTRSPDLLLMWACLFSPCCARVGRALENHMLSAQRRS